MNLLKKAKETESNLNTKNESESCMTNNRIFQVCLLLIFSCCLIFAIVIGVVRLTTYAVDNWFMFENTEYLLKDGFPIYDFITLHEGLHYMMPQWLFAVIVTFLRPIGDGLGISLFMVLVVLILAFVQIKNSILISDRSPNSIMITILPFILFLLYFCYIRPFVVSVLLCCTMIYFIEKWIHSKNWKWLIMVPILSVLQINFHNSLWIALILIWICYIVEWFIHKIRKTNCRFSIKPLFIVLLGILVGGLINPYGLEAITYIFKSLISLKYIKPFIGELNCPPLLSYLPFYIFMTVEFIWFLYLYIKKKKTIPLAYLFMWAGFGILGIAAARNVIFFFTCAQMPLFYSSRWIPAVLPCGMRKTLYATSIIGIIISSFGVVPPNQRTLDPWMEDINTFTETFTIEGDICFVTQHDGTYAAYKGFVPYIDCRAELFGKAVNGKKEIAKEYDFIMREASVKEIEEFYDSYNFEWLLLRNELYEGHNLGKAAESKYTMVYQGKELTFLWRNQ